MTNKLQIEISPGEAYDRMSILSVKAQRIKDQQKNRSALNQFELLLFQVIDHMQQYDQSIRDNVTKLYDELCDINNRLWDIEDGKRACEACQNFDDNFIQLARSVYLLNDERHTKKREIDQICGSNLAEQKEYTNYEKDQSAN